MNTERVRQRLFTDSSLPFILSATSSEAPSDPLEVLARVFKTTASYTTGLNSLTPIGLLFATFCHGMTSLAGKRKFNRLKDAELQTLGAFLQFCSLNGQVALGRIHFDPQPWSGPFNALCRTYQSENPQLIEPLAKAIESFSLEPTPPINVLNGLQEKTLHVLETAFSLTPIHEPTGDKVIKQFVLLHRCTDACERMLEFEKERFINQLKKFEEGFAAYSKACEYIPRSKENFQSFLESKSRALLNAFETTCREFSLMMQVDGQPIQLLVNRERLETVLGQSDDIQLAYRYIKAQQKSFNLIADKLLEKDLARWIHETRFAYEDIADLFHFPAYLALHPPAAESPEAFEQAFEKMKAQPKAEHERLLAYIAVREGAAAYYPKYLKVHEILVVCLAVCVGANQGLQSVAKAFQEALSHYTKGSERKEGKQAARKLEQELMRGKHRRTKQQVMQKKVVSVAAAASSQPYSRAWRIWKWATSCFRWPNASSFFQPLLSLTRLFWRVQPQQTAPQPRPVVARQPVIEESDSEEEPELTASSSNASTQVQRSVPRWNGAWLKKTALVFNNPFAVKCMKNAQSAQQDFLLEFERLSAIKDREALIEGLSSWLVSVSLLSEQAFATCLLELEKPKTRQEALNSLCHDQQQLVDKLKQLSPQGAHLSLDWVQQVGQLDCAFRAPAPGGNEGMQLLLELENARHGSLTETAWTQLVKRSIAFIFDHYGHILKVVAQETQQPLPNLSGLKECRAQALEQALRIPAKAPSPIDLQFQPLVQQLSAIQQRVKNKLKQNAGQLEQEERRAALKWITAVERHLHFIQILLKQSPSPLRPALLFKKMVRSLFPAIVQLCACQALIKGKGSAQQVEQDVISHNLWSSVERLAIPQSRLSVRVKTLLDESESAFNLNRYLSFYEQFSDQETLQPWMQKSEVSKKREEREEPVEQEEGWTESQSRSTRLEGKRQQEILKKSSETLQAALELINVLLG